MRKKILFLSAVVFILHGSIPLFAGSEITLAAKRRTSYAIFTERKLSPQDHLAVQELHEHVQAVSRARLFFHYGKFAPERNYVFIGQTPEVRRILGKDNLYDTLKDEQHVVQVKGKHLFLYGKGVYGNLYAVYDFLEKDLGIRFLSPLGYTHIPKKDSIILKQGVRKSRPYAFSVRSMSNFFYGKTGALYFLRNRMNFRNQTGEYTFHAAANFNFKTEILVHNLARVIPGFSKKYHRFNKLFKGQDYFKTNPEYFSMDEHGKRVNDRQVCFSNRDLRKLLTKNSLIYYEHRKNTGAYGKSMLGIDLNDIAYNMCYCKECQALQKKYKTPGGAFFEFLYEFCRKYPDISFVTLAYQCTLTQIAPKGLGKAPENLTVIFCPINGSFAGTLPGVNKKDLDSLKEWTSMCSNVWIWYYPNTYGSLNVPVVPPRSIFYRLAADVKALRDAGAKGTYFEHNAGGTRSAVNLTEMQTYILLQLFRDPDQNIDKLMEEFARLYYGKAAPEILAFARELEKLREEDNKNKRHWNYNFNHFSYLTEANLIRWNALLDKAEKKVRGRFRLHVQLVRTGVDCALVDMLRVSRRNDKLLKERIAGLRSTAKNIKAYRHRTLYPADTLILKWLNSLKNVPVPKPFPKEMAELPSGRVEVVLPGRLVPKGIVVADKDANQNFAVWEPFNGKSYTWRTYAPHRKELIHVIRAKDIKKDRYALYKLFDKPILLSPEMILRGERYNRLTYFVGHLCPYDDPMALKQKWIPYASIKFTDKKAFIDRIFMVRAK